MTYSTNMQFKKISALIGVFAVSALVSFGALTAHAQYDYSAPSYDSGYSGSSYGSDYSAPSYGSSYNSGSSYSDYSAPSYSSNYNYGSSYSDYSAPSYTSDYSAPSYSSSNYSAPSYTSDYSAPSYTSSYSAPSYTSDYSAPSYTSDYSAPSYTSDYSAPSYTSDYSAPSYTSDYSAPSYTSDYSAPSYTSDYSAPSYTSDYSAPSYTSDYSAPSYTSDYSAPSYTSDYSAPSYTSDYSAPSYTSDYSAPSYTSDYSAPSYTSGYTTPGYTSSYIASGYTPTYSNPVYTGGSYVNTPSYTCGTSCGGGSYYTPTYVQPVVVPTQPHVTALSGSCFVNVPSVQTGNSLVWSAIGVSGGIGNYTYSWTGTDGLSASGSSISKIYNTAGTKSATLTIRSDGQSITRTCYSQVVAPVITHSLTGSCVASTNNTNINSNVTWSATGVSGGNGNYTYSWTGTDGLSGNGQNISKSYSYAGTKNAVLTIYSNGQSVTANCNTYVSSNYVPPVYNSLNASCIANQTSAYTGDNVNWSATNVSGGNGNYTYSWSGTDGLYSNSQYAYKSYNTAGTKFAYLTVYSNGQSVTRTCSLYVNNRYNPVVTYTNPVIPYSGYNGVALSQVPYTGLDSNMKVILFALGLGLWSAFVTYVIILRKKAKIAAGMVPAIAAMKQNKITIGSNSADAQQSARKEMLMNSSNFTDDLSSYARTQNVIISTDALQSIANVSGGSSRKAQSLINSLASRFSTGDEYTTIDSEKVQSAIGQS